MVHKYPYSCPLVIKRGKGFNHPFCERRTIRHGLVHVKIVQTTGLTPTFFSVPVDFHVFPQARSGKNRIESETKAKGETWFTFAHLPTQNPVVEKTYIPLNIHFFCRKPHGEIQNPAMPKNVSRGFCVPLLLELLIRNPQKIPKLFP